MKRMMLGFCLAMGLTLGASRGATWHVAVDGSDEASGGAGDPFLTISNALAHADDGDTVLVAAGDYDVAETVSLTNGVTVRGVAGRDATVLAAIMAERRPLHVNHAQAVFEGFTVTGGFLTGESGGGAYLQAGTITNCLFTGNVVSNAATALRGGGIYAVGGRIVDCVISNNVLFSIPSTSPYGGGGGLALDASGWADGCVIANNLATNGAWGGGASLHGAATRLTGCEVRANQADRGGGVHAYRGYVSGCTIEENRALYAFTIGLRTGGGVYFSGSTGDFQCLDNSMIRANWASSGGGVGLGYNVTVSNCIILANYGYAGGGIYNQMGTTSLIRNCLIVSNASYSAGGIYLYRSGGKIDNCTIVGNTSGHWSADWSAGGIFLQGELGTDAVINNTIVYFNSNVGQAPSQNYRSISTYKLYFNNSCTTPTNGLNGADYISDDPEFLNPAAASHSLNPDDYQLSPQSPCLNRGKLLDWMSGAYDLLGNPRVDGQSGIPDMGCFERVPPPWGTTVIVR